MADNKMVKEITSMDEDFAKWYTDIVIKAELIDYSSVRGCMVIRPYGYAIWEQIQKHLELTIHFLLSVLTALTLKKVVKDTAEVYSQL